MILSGPNPRSKMERVYSLALSLQSEPGVLVFEGYSSGQLRWNHVDNEAALVPLDPDFYLSSHGPPFGHNLWHVKDGDKYRMTFTQVLVKYCTQS